MDAILIEELEVYYRVGVPDEERAKPQRLLLSLRLEHDFGAAAATDNLVHTIDYYAVTRRLLQLGEGREWRLIEKLAVDIAETVLREFHPHRVSVTVKKFIIPEARWVAVQLTRPADCAGRGPSPHSGS